MSNPLLEEVDRVAREAAIKIHGRAYFEHIVERHRKWVESQGVLDLTNVLGSMWMGRVGTEIHRFEAETARSPKSMKMRYCHGVQLARELGFDPDELIDSVWIYGIRCDFTDRPPEAPQFVSKIVLSEMQR